MITRALILPFAAALFAAGTQPALAAPLSLQSTLSDGAVLQRGKPIVISGSAAPGSAVQVGLGGVAGSATAGADGRWEARLPARDAAEGLTLTVSSGTDQLELHDLAIGDVVLCSGQSNMEFSMGQSAMADNDRKQPIDHSLRLLTVPQGGARVEQPEFAKPARWQVAFGQAQDFSAVCLFAGRELARQRKVTIGLIDSSLGSTVIESWLPLDGLKQLAGFDRESAMMAAFNDDQPKAEASFGPMLDALWKEVPATKDNPGRSRIGYGNLFNAMIAPLSKTAISGVIWYQGESNARNADRREVYRAKLDALEASWRRRFGAGLPFVIVQIAPFGPLSGKVEESTWAEVREAQRLVTMNDRASALVVTSDVGERLYIHPPIKKPVGARAGTALASLLSSGAIAVPGLRPGRVYRQGNVVHLEIEGGSGGLIAASWGRPGPFELCRGDQSRDCRFADARLEQGGIAVDVAAGFNPDHLRYCWGAAPICNVFDSTEQPLGPFEAAIASR